MTVSELVGLLSQLPPEETVYIEEPTYGGHIDRIYREVGGEAILHPEGGVEKARIFNPEAFLG